MIWYTVRLNKHSKKIFTDKAEAEQYVKLFRYRTGRMLTIIERRKENDTHKPETYT